jgi:hypothetical protein
MMERWSAAIGVVLLVSTGFGCSSSSMMSSPGGGGSGAGTGTGGSGTGSGSGGASGSGNVTGGTGQAGFTGTGSTVNGFFIPNDHPRLFWTPARLALAKTWWQSNAYTPSSSDDDVIQMVAYMMTGKTSYCTNAINDAMSIDLSDCTADKAGCDDSRWSGEDAIIAYDWCYAVMTDSQRSTFTTNWNKWLTAISQEAWGGVGQSQSNYYSGNLRNEAEWGIASYYENQTAATALLNDALVTRYANDLTPASIKAGQGLGGLALEGGQYGPYQGYYVGAVIFPSIAAAGRDIFDETPYWKGTVLNRIYMTPPQQTMGQTRGGWDVFPFGDDETWQDGSPAAATEKGTFMTAAANQWNSSNIGGWARQWLATVSPTVDPAAASTDVGGTSEAFTSLPLDYYDGGPQDLVGRSDWTANATSYFWEMGDHYSDGHEHADFGQFQINRKGRWLARETVGYTETVPGYGGTGAQAINTGLAHNVPLVNGAPAGGGNSAPVLNRLESQAGYAYADVDLTNAWGKGVSHVEREYWFIRDIETFVVLDRLVSSSASQSKTFVIHCETNPTLVDATHIHCVDGSEQLAITTLLPTAPSSRTVINEANVSGGEAPPPQNVQYRVEINDMPNATASYTLHVLQAMDTTGTLLAPTLTDSAPGTPATGTFTVKLDSSHSLTINKGMTSSGGSITVAGNATTLRTDVEPFAIGSDDVPVWGP